MLRINIWKKTFIKLSFWWICIFNVKCLCFKTILNFVLSDARSSFSEPTKPLRLSKVSFRLFLHQLTAIELYDSWSNFLFLLSYFQFVLFVNIVIIYFLLSWGAFFFVVSKTSMSRFKRSLLNLYFFEIFQIILLFLNFLWNVGMSNIILTNRWVT